MKIKMDWDFYFRIGFFLCLIYFIIDKSWLSLISIGVYTMIVLIISIGKSKHDVNHATGEGDGK